MSVLKTVVRVIFGAAPRRIWKENGLINTTDLLVATGATVVLAASVSSAVIGTLDDAKYGKAQPDVQAMASAISQFYKDTGKWPGQAEQAAASGTNKPATFLVTAGVTDTDVLPTAETTALTVADATCGNNSLDGFPGATIDSAALTSATRLNINDYLVRKPDETRYPNWQGPYMQGEVRTDPWDRAWVLNLQPLYCAEVILDAAGSTSALTGGALGYGWILSGGTNRTVSTLLSATRLDPTADDSGTTLGKLVKRGAGGVDAD
jgi:hypothetical protein